ncbi:MAG: glycosyltransferase family 4 protein [Ignavibacteria bacterium]
MKKAIIHEWFVNYAGSERCVESFTNMWTDAEVYSLVDFLNDHDRGIILKGKKAHTSFIQTLPFAKKKHRNYLAFFPIAIEQFDLAEYDIILSSSHAVAKGVLTNPNQMHICYCHTPIRYAWDHYHQYLREANLTKGIGGLIAKSVLHYLRVWDYTASNRVDHYIANSKHIAKRIKKIYGRDSEVIYPPVDINLFPVRTDKENFYLTASRLVPYKRIDLIVEAFSKMPDNKLVVIGHGPEMNKIKEKAGRNVEILGYQPFDQLKDYMQRAKAFVFAAEEDFGIIIVEAQSCGTPVIALNKGGTSETVVNGLNGIHFNEQTSDSIIGAVKNFEKAGNNFDAVNISNIAKGYSREIFEANIRRFIDIKSSEFFSK